jgi:hypothetical protein
VYHVEDGGCTVQRDAELRYIKNMPTTHIRTARPGETSRPVIRFKGRYFETLASPTFISAGVKVKIQEVPTSAYWGTLKRIVVARVGTEGWETWEEC